MPAELKPACGNAGAEVHLVNTALPVTVDKSACDLTGVIVHWKDGVDAVPGGDLADTNTKTACSSDSGANCPSITVDPQSGAVTIAPAG